MRGCQNSAVGVGACGCSDEWSAVRVSWGAKYCWSIDVWGKFILGSRLPDMEAILSVFKNRRLVFSCCDNDVNIPATSSIVMSSYAFKIAMSLRYCVKLFFSVGYGRRSGRNSAVFAFHSPIFRRAFDFGL